MALLEAEGWAVTRGAGSKGAADLWAACSAVTGMFHDEAATQPVVTTDLRLVQVKSDKATPYGHFGPADRQALLNLAKRTGGTAELAWWPAHGPLTWIPASEWP